MNFASLGDSRVLPPALRGPFDGESQRWRDALEVAGYDPIHDLRPCRVKPISCGRLFIVQGGRRTGAGIPVIGYLLQTPDELLVVDGGLSPRWREGGEVHMGPDDSPSPGTPYMPALDGPSLAEQVARMGLAPDRVMCTHLHEDHSSGAAELGLPVEAAAAEWARLDEPNAGANGYPVEELAGVSRRTIELDPSAPLGPFVASARINADVIAVDSAGHTPGSISLLACLGAAWVLICGDAVYPRMDEPGSAAWRGMLRISRALEDVRALRLLPAHDTSVLRTVEGDDWIGSDAIHAAGDHGEESDHDGTPNPTSTPTVAD
jgi:glyoxylase-like metal-dependent hydrolase (beta-lactamase superfamily II)